jgi:hypothetical protein
MDIVVLLTGTLIAFISSAVMLRYLSIKTSTTADKERLSKSLEREKSEMIYYMHKVHELQQKIDEFSKSQLAVSEDERNELIENLTERMREEASEEFFSDIKKQAKIGFKHETLYIRTEKQFVTTTRRLKDELDSLSRRGNLNLIIGILTTVVGFYLLGVFVFSPVGYSHDIEEFSINFIPRISLVILLEVFAYFFLRLYKTSLSEIKYFQNEITSIEAKYLALKLAHLSQDPANIQHVIQQLAKTERNFILEKGQSTVALQQANIEAKHDNALLDRLASLLEKYK